MESKHVLIVEDDRSMRWLLQKQVEKLRYTADCVFNGAEALRKLRENSYRVVIMDISMPVMDGLETTRRIRAAEREQRQPRVAIVAVTGACDREQCIDAGADDFFPVPLSMDDMRNILQRWAVPNGQTEHDSHRRDDARQHAVPDNDEAQKLVPGDYQPRPDDDDEEAWVRDTETAEPDERLDVIDE